MLDTNSKGTANAASLADESLSTARRSFGTDAARRPAGDLTRYQHTFVISSLVATFAPCKPEDSS